MSARRVRTLSTVQVQPIGPAPASLPRISVCMATYDGERFVGQQLASILAEIAPGDEVVVVDDASSDSTVARLRELHDPRVRIIESDQNRGYVRAFERALCEARGEYVLLADQDDVWTTGRVRSMVDALGHVDVVATNLATLGGPDRITGPYGQSDWRLRARHSGRNVRNIVAVLAGNRPYYGCAMGIRRRALVRVLPFPDFLDESHDLWIALHGNVARSIRHLEFRSVQRRFHGGNATPDRPRGPVGVARSRLMLVRCVIELRRRGGGRGPQVKGG